VGGLESTTASNQSVAPTIAGAPSTAIDQSKLLKRRQRLFLTDLFLDFAVHNAINRCSREVDLLAARGGQSAHG
jgi:hypothetical protein